VDRQTSQPVVKYVPNISALISWSDIDVEAAGGQRWPRDGPHKPCRIRGPGTVLLPVYSACQRPVAAAVIVTFITLPYECKVVSLWCLS